MSEVFNSGEDPTPNGLDVEAVRARMLQAVEEEKAKGMTLPKIAENSRIPYTTLTAWLKDAYNGKEENVAAKATSWLVTRAAHQRTQHTRRREPGFLKTQTAERVFNLLEHAQTTPDIVTISGAPGVGKTTALLSYQAMGANVWVITAEPVHTTIGTLLALIADALNLQRRHSAADMSKSIRERLMGREGLVIIDEANHLPFALIEQVRSMVYDGASTGVALVGNDLLDEQFTQARAAGKAAQLVSRVGNRMNAKAPSRDDVEKMLHGWGLQEPDVRQFATGIAMKPGHLRQMGRVLRTAFALAALRRAEEPTVSELKTAWRQLGGAN